MALGAGNLARGSNANRLRGDGTPTSSFSITATVPDHKSFRYDISTTYAQGAQLYVLFVFNQQVYPELFGYAFDTVNFWNGIVNTYQLSANVTVDANGNASINSSINLHQLTNTANTIAFNSPTTITTSVSQQDKDGQYVGGLQAGVTLKKDTQDEVLVANSLGNPVGAISTISVSDWDDYFPAAVDEGWDSTEFTHLRIIRSQGATGNFYEWGVDYGTFREPVIPGSVNKDLPVHAVLQGNYKPSNNQYIPLSIIDLYNINSPALEEMWLRRQQGNTLGLNVGFNNDTIIQYAQGDTGSNVTASSANGTQRQSGYPINPRVPFSSAYPANEIGFWYPLRGPDGEFITANAT